MKLAAGSPTAGRPEAPSGLRNESDLSAGTTSALLDHVDRRRSGTSWSTSLPVRQEMARPQGSHFLPDEAAGREEQSVAASGST